MFTAKIISIAKFQGRINIVVEITNGTDTWQEEFSSTVGVDLEWLKRLVREKINAFTAAYAFADTLTKDQAIDLTAPAAKTQAELDQELWLKRYDKWLSVKRAIDAEILAGTEPAVTSLKTWVINNFKAAYLDFI